MTLSIPHRWLIPRRKPVEWKFQCYTNLWDLVRTHRAASYCRQIVHILENDHQIVDYHLKIRHNYHQNNYLDVYIYFDDPNRTQNPEPLLNCISCDPEHELSRASLINERQHTRAWLDGRARPKLILTPIRHVERLSDLRDDEMEAFWQDTVDLVKQETNTEIAFYPTIVINHGTYRNYSHLHMKISFRDDQWKKTVASHRKEQLRALKELNQNAEMIGECFGEYAVKKQ